MTAADAALLLVAGVVAGIVGTAGGTASLISYPALLAVGIPPLAANVTNSLSIVATWPGSALGSRSELRGQAKWLWHQAPIAAAGGASGAALLLLTPGEFFDWIVPFLVSLGSIALLLQPRITAWQNKHLKRNSRFLLPCGLFAASVYDGYWGAGAGVMVLALLLLTIDQDFALSNALKNMILGVADVVCSIGFALFGPVRWTAAVPLALGFLVGSIVGPHLARRIPGNVLRIIVALGGFGLAVHLWFAR